MKRMMIWNWRDKKSANKSRIKILTSNRKFLRAHLMKKWTLIGAIGSPRLKM
jgi:hypothetical protein